MTQKIIRNLVIILMLLTFSSSRFIPTLFAAQKEAGIDWKKAALLIIDIQNDYFPGGKKEVFESEKAALKAKDLLTAFRQNKLTVIHIRHEGPPNSTYFLPNTPGAEIHPLVKPLAGEAVILKHKPSSFFETNLLKELEKREICQLIICGMRTNVCVQATTLEALTLAFKVTVVEDAVAALDITEHQAGLKAITDHQVPLVKTDVLIESIGR